MSFATFPLHRLREVFPEWCLLLDSHVQLCTLCMCKILYKMYVNKYCCTWLYCLCSCSETTNSDVRSLVNYMLDTLLQLFQWRIYRGCSAHGSPKTGCSLCIASSVITLQKDAFMRQHSAYILLITSVCSIHDVQIWLRTICTSM